jgi:protein-tyrosine phosphatase
MNDAARPRSDGDAHHDPYRVVVVCLGNICRSPTAAAVLRDRLDKAGLSEQVEVDSAGTGDWHVGQPADSRAAETLRRHGYDDAHRARQFQRHEFAEFDLVLAADASNATDLRDLAPTPDGVDKVRLLRSFDPGSPPGAEVPDPYYGADGFDEVLAIIEAACDHLVDRLAAGERPGRTTPR